MSALVELAGVVRESHSAEVWREDPVSLEEFVCSPRHLGQPGLYQRQRKAIRELLRDDPKRVFDDPLTAAKKWRRMYQGAVLLWGKGSGKDYLCSIVVCYLIHILLCLRDPQEFLKLAPGEAIDVVNVAYNADQAKKVFFAKLKARIERWAWLRDNFNIVEAGKRVNEHQPGRGLVQVNDDFIEFPNKIRAWSRHAQNESYEGLNVIAWIMDEASAFLSKLKRENAESIYQTLKTSAASRFGLRWVGLIISYPRHADDFTMTKHREAMLDPTLGWYADGPAATWEINEITRDEPRIHIEGTDLEVPASLANDFLADLTEALSRYCCQPPLAREAFFPFPQRLWEAVDKGRQPLIEWEPVELRREEGDGKIRTYRGVRLTKLRGLPKGAKLYAHGDPGLVNDSYALAIGHAVPATIVRMMPAREVLPHPQLLHWVHTGHDPDELIEWEIDVPKTVIDALIVWRPDKRRQIEVDLQNVEDTIFELKRVYPSLGHFPRKQHGETKRKPTLTTDRWESAQAIQRMRSRKMNVENEAWGRDFQVQIYRNARTSFHNSLVDLPDTPSVTSVDPRDPGAIYEMERVEFIDAVKVDHPEGGSKDSADAVVRVIQHATEHNKAGVTFGGVFGHRTQYQATGPMLPSERPSTDPNRTPGITDHQREQERQRRTERPLGDLSPSEGTVNNRRLAFGSLNTRRGP